MAPLAACAFGIGALVHTHIHSQWHKVLPSPCSAGTLSPFPSPLWLFLVTDLSTQRLSSIAWFDVARAVSVIVHSSSHNKLSYGGGRPLVLKCSMSSRQRTAWSRFPPNPTPPQMPSAVAPVQLLSLLNLPFHSKVHCDPKRAQPRRYAVEGTSNQHPPSPDITPCGPYT